MLAALALGAAYPAAAQADTHVYAYAEQMPQLPGGGNGSIQAAIRQNFKLPADARAANISGQVFLRFTVASTGRPEDVVLVKGLSASIDAAAIEAVKKLPTFIPGKQNGQAVKVSLTIPLQVGELASQTVREVPADEKVYTYVEQMSALPGGGGTAAIVEAVQQRLVVPAGTSDEGRIFVKFTVRTEGSVADAEIVKGLSEPLNAAALAAVRQLPRFVPGKQNGREVAVSFTLPVTIYRPDHVFEARELNGSTARFPGIYTYYQQHLKVPAVVASEKLHGLVGVDLVVLPSGKIDQPTLTSHVCASCDAEVLRAVQAMPAWQPAQRGGHPVAVRQHLDVPLPLPNPQVATALPAEVPAYASHPATLLDGTTGPALETALRQAVRVPEVARREKISGTVQVEFIVDANGAVRDSRVLQPLCNSCDQAVLEAVQAQVPFLPAYEADKPVATRLRLAVPFIPEAAGK